MHPNVTQRLSVVASALSANPREAPRQARLAGFRGLLFDAWSSSLSTPELSASGRRDFVRMISSQDQLLVGLQMDLGARGLSPGADVDRQIERMDRALESAVGLLAPLLCVDLGSLPRAAQAQRPKPKVSAQQAGLIIIPELAANPPEGSEAPPPAPDPAFVSQLQSALVEIGMRCDRYGVTIAFSSSLAAFAALEQALRTARCPWFGVDLDPVAILRDEWSRDEIFSALGPLIRHVRIRDAIAGDDRRIKPAQVGRGGIEWEQMLALLDEAAFTGWLTADPLELTDRGAAAAAAAAHLGSFGR